MKERLLKIVSLLVVILISITFSLISCKGTTKETAEKVTEETEGTTEEVVEDLTAGNGKHFENVSIYFFAGGPEGDPFASVVYKGAVDAENDLGCEVTYVFSNWNSETMVTQFKEAIALKPDGIAMMGHPGQDAFWPLVEEAVEKGIILTSQNVVLPDIEAKYSYLGYGYVGADNYEMGLTCAKTVIRKYDLQAGDKGVVWGNLSREARSDRAKGCIDGLEEAGIIVDYVEMSEEGNSDATLEIPKVAAYLISHPDIKVFLADAGALSTVIKNIMVVAKKEPGEIKVGSFDLSPATVESIREGYLGFVVDQLPYLQGYLPILQVCLAKEYKMPGLRILTGVGIVDETNIDALAELVEEGIR